MFAQKPRASHAIQLLLFLAALHQGVQNCIKVKLVGVKSTDTIDYREKIIENSDNSLSIVVNVLKLIPSPLWNIQLLQSGEDFKKVHYIGNMKSCELGNLVKKVRLLRELSAPFFDPKLGNLSMALTCPLQVGTYVAKNVVIPPESSFLRFLYVPNTILTLKGSIYSLMSNNQKEKLAAYEYNYTTFRTC